MQLFVGFVMQDHIWFYIMVFGSMLQKERLKWNIAIFAVDEH